MVPSVKHLILGITSDRDLKVEVGPHVGLCAQQGVCGRFSPCPSTRRARILADKIFKTACLQNYSPKFLTLFFHFLKMSELTFTK